MKQWFVENNSVGILKKGLYQFMQHLFKFSEWHITPINHRPYALEIYRTLNYYINKQEMFPDAPMIEVGCGLGDIIGNLRWCYGKIGLDLSINALKAAKLIHPTVTFRKGSFSDIHCKNISCLIMVNFIHIISYEDLKKYIDEILEKSCVEMFVLDTFRNNEGTEYKYSHDGNFLFNGMYKLLKRSHGFAASNGARRYIEYWKVK